MKIDDRDTESTKFTQGKLNLEHYLVYSELHRSFQLTPSILVFVACVILPMAK